MPRFRKGGRRLPGGFWEQFRGLRQRVGVGSCPVEARGGVSPLHSFPRETMGLFGLVLFSCLVLTSRPFLAFQLPTLGVEG